MLVLNVNTGEGSGSGLFLKELRCGKRPVIVARHLLQGTDLKCDTFKEAWCGMKQNGKPSDTSLTERRHQSQDEPTIPNGDSLSVSWEN